MKSEHRRESWLSGGWSRGSERRRRDGRHPGTPSPSESAALSESGAGLTGRTLVETMDEVTGTVATAAATADCGKSGPGTGAKFTSEAKLGEHAGIAKTHKNKEISPDFGVEPGLDKMKTNPIRARRPRGAGTTPSPSPAGRAEGFAHARPRLTAAARGARAAGKAIYTRARREVSRRFRLNAALQHHHAQQNWPRSSRLRWSPAFRRRVSRRFRLKAGLQQDHAQQNWHRASRLRWSPAFRRRVSRRFRLKAARQTRFLAWFKFERWRVASCGWLGSSWQCQRAPGVSLAPGASTFGLRPQPPRRRYPHLNQARFSCLFECRKTVPRPDATRQWC